MSIRAYRVKNIEHKPSDTYGMIVSYWSSLRTVRPSILIAVELLIEALGEAILKAQELDLDSDILMALQADMDSALSMEEDWIGYYC